MELSPCSLLSCGYSVHTRPFASKRVLSCYLIRYQTEGSSRIAINGNVMDFHAGDLLVAAPGDDYALQTGFTEEGKAIRCSDYYLSCQVQGDCVFLRIRQLHPFQPHVQQALRHIAQTIQGIQ